MTDESDTGIPDGDMESVEAFAARARSWLAEHMPRAADGVGGFRGVHGADEEELAQIEHCRQLQRVLFDGGFAGICVPRAYGGQGLTGAHQQAFNREIRGYQYPSETQVPTLTPCMAIILEFGDEQQKRRHIPPILRGETLWMQFLSEPGGGSDLAGALTTAVRDGEEWILNGSKIWTTGAWWADWALCLARTNWDVPKHRGLSVFMLPIRQPGIEVHRIEMVNGSREFCQEFITDVRVPDDMRIGPADGGWAVALRWMYHERTIAAGLAVRDRAGRAAGGGTRSDRRTARAPSRAPAARPGRRRTRARADRRIPGPPARRRRPLRVDRRADPRRHGDRALGRHHASLVRHERGA